jgi:ketosteroid isomerase-like protein
MGICITISHEPFGEARIGFPPNFPMPDMTQQTVGIVIASIQFVTPDVALAEATCTCAADGGDRLKASSMSMRWLFVMKRDGSAWQIADRYRLYSPK